MEKLSSVQMHWLESHIGTIDDAKKIAEDFTWKLTITERDGTWSVLDGEVKIFSSPEKKDIEIFLYGLGLAYAVLPNYEQVKKEVSDWASDL